MAAADDKQVGARALVTGGAGFIGSHIVDGLLARGDAVRVVDDLSSGSEANLEGALAAGAELEVADVSDRAAFADAVAGFAPNVIFHLAAQADVRRSVADPEFDARVNVIGTINALEIARSVPGCRFVFSATGGAVYGEGDEHPLPFREDFPVEPLTPYGASKLAAEGYIATFQRLHAVPGAALRFGNVYGPRQDPHGEAGVVAIFCGRILDGAPPTIFGDGSQTRDYIYVDDVVAACLAADAVLASGRVINGPINVGTGVRPPSSKCSRRSPMRVAATVRTSSPRRARASSTGSRSTRRPPRRSWTGGRPWTYARASRGRTRASPPSAPEPRRAKRRPDYGGGNFPLPPENSVISSRSAKTV